MKWYHFWAEILFGLAILTFNEYAVFLLFIYLAIRLTVVFELLRKLIRVYQVANEVKIIAIMHKLKISEKDILDIIDSSLGELTEKQREQLNKDFKDVVGFPLAAAPKEQITEALKQAFGK